MYNKYEMKREYLIILYSTCFEVKKIKYKKKTDNKSFDGTCFRLDCHLNKKTQIQREREKD